MTLRHVLGDGLNFPRATRELKLMQTLETVTIRDFDIWCTAIGRRRKKFGLRFLPQQQDLETILKDLGYLERLSLSAADMSITYRLTCLQVHLLLPVPA